jgi:hypothetical protein
VDKWGIVDKAEWLKDTTSFVCPKGKDLVGIEGAVTPDGFVEGLRFTCRDTNASNSLLDSVGSWGTISSGTDPKVFKFSDKVDINRNVEAAGIPAGTDTKERIENPDEVREVAVRKRYRLLALLGLAALVGIGWHYYNRYMEVRAAMAALEAEPDFSFESNS